MSLPVPGTAPLRVLDELGQSHGYRMRQVGVATGSARGGSSRGLRHRAVSVRSGTDFTFSVAGGTRVPGQRGVGLVLGLPGLLGLLVRRTLMIALRAREACSRLEAIGLACWFSFQIFENMGMNLSTVPVTGLRLPFVSYGGWSLFACWLGAGPVNNVHLSGLDDLRKR